jgi:hypothetical protein
VLVLRAEVAVGESPRDQADRHFRGGVELAARKDFAGAASEFEQAMELSPHPTALYNLAQAYAHSGRPAHALRALEQYLEEAGGALTTARREEIEKLIVRSRARIGWLRLPAGTPADALSVDGRIEQPDAEGRIAVGVGQHRVVWLLKAQEPRLVTVEVAAGQTVDIVPITPGTPAAPDAPVAPPLEPLTSPGQLRVECHTPNAKVSIDGKAPLTTPVEVPLMLDPGVHTVTFERPGYVALSVKVTMEPGGSAVARCLMKPVIRRTTSPAATASDRDPRALGPRFWAYVSGGVGLGLLAGGVTTYWLNTEAFDRWKARKQAWIEQAGARTPPGWREEGTRLDRDLQHIQRVDDVATGVALVGTALLGTGVALWLIHSPNGPRAAVRVGPDRVEIRGEL